MPSDNAPESYLGPLAPPLGPPPRDRRNWRLARDILNEKTNSEDEGGDEGINHV